MKNYFLYIVILVSTVGFSQQVVKAQLDTTNIRIGEQILYQISVQETQNVIIPKLENLKGLEVVSEQKLDTLKNQLIKKYVLTGFDSGAYYIPQQQVFIRGKLHLTDSLLVSVATVAVDTVKQKAFPIKNIQNEPYQFDDVKPYLWMIILGLVLLGLLLYFIFRKKKEVIEKVIVPLLAPYEDAIQKLHLLDEKLLWQNNKTKQYYSELTEIVRTYIERELKVPALESTTDELVETLKDFNDSDAIVTTNDIIKLLKSLLQEADLVKFAKSTPLSEAIEANRKDAKIIIDNLKPKPIIDHDGLE